MEGQTVWIVGRYRAQLTIHKDMDEEVRGDEVIPCAAWDLLGVASSLELAAATCEHSLDFFFPVDLDDMHPRDDDRPRIASTWPRRIDKPVTDGLVSPPPEDG